MSILVQNVQPIFLSLRLEFFISNLINSFHKYLFCRDNVKIQDIIVRWLVVNKLLSLSLCYRRWRILKWWGKVQSGENTKTISYRGTSHVSRKGNQPLADNHRPKVRELPVASVSPWSSSPLLLLLLSSPSSPNTLYPKHLFYAFFVFLIMKHLHIWKHDPNQVITHHFLQWYQAFFKNVKYKIIPIHFHFLSPLQ